MNGSARTVGVLILITPHYERKSKDCWGINCYKGSSQKTGIPGPFGAKNRHILKSSNKCTPRALPLVQSVLYLVLAGYSRGTPEFVYSA